MTTGLGARLRSLSLRRRVALAFGLVTLTVAGLLSVVTWQLASSFMTSHRLETATTQAAEEARLVGDDLARGGGGLDRLLAGITGAPDTTVLLRVHGRWTVAGRPVELAALPAALTDPGPGAAPTRTRLDVGGVPSLAVSTALGVDGDRFVRLTPLDELERTLWFLGAVLVAGTAISGVLGMLLGWWTAKRALRPLTELTSAASQVAEGDLRTRLPARAEADLAPLAGAFNATADALEERVQRDARFAGDVSHELRSPLTTMINAGEVLRRRRDELSEPARRAVDLLTADIRRFHRMVEDLLEISRGIQVPEVRDREPVVLAHLVDNIPAHLTRHAAVDTPSPSPVVLADRRRLDRVLANLCENAEHHAGGVVRIAVSRRDAHGVIEIDDDGPGIPADMLTQVFERFTRGDRAGHRGGDTGTGLGLALVAQHVRAHHGRVWAENRPGGGARFVVELPEAAP